MPAVGRVFAFQLTTVIMQDIDMNKTHAAFLAEKTNHVDRT